MNLELVLNLGDLHDADSIVSSPSGVQQSELHPLDLQWMESLGHNARGPFKQGLRAM